MRIFIHHKRKELEYERSYMSGRATNEVLLRIEYTQM